MTSTDVLLELPADTDAPAIARRIVTEHLVGFPDALVEDASLLVSELVGNAVRYGKPAITLRVRRRPPGIGIAVHDDGEALPTMPDGRPDPAAPTGRGLLIVAALADAWGVTTSQPAPGKTVWFELNPPVG